jgi:hypothetical protein
MRRSRITSVLTIAALLVLGVGLARSSAPPRPEAKLSEREARFLELALEQTRKIEKNLGFPGRQPLGAGALAAAALSAQGRPDAAALRKEAAQRVEAILGACARWHTNECARAQLPLQRVVLQYPEALPAELLVRLRKAASNVAPPPNPGLLKQPWGFGETENQMMIKMGRSLVGHVVAGTPNSPEARAWGEYAQAFLLAHDRDGWYEAESPGYLALSVTALLQLADHAPQPAVRDLATRQLNLLFAGWAQEQVGGYPAGAKSRTYSFWAFSQRGNPWASWAWLAAGVGDPADLYFADRPELPVSRYEIPEAVALLVKERRKQPPYEIRKRRTIAPDKRRDLDTALYSYATPDYILGAAQSIGGLTLRVSGGQEIVATLFAEGPEFAPLYLWGRTRDPHKKETGWNVEDLAAAHRNLLVARVGKAGPEPGHAFLSRPWTDVEVVGDAVVARSGDAYVALVTEGGWEVAPAAERFPSYYAGDNHTRKILAGSRVAVPRRQPATIALEAGRRAEHGSFEDWKKRAAKARLQFAGPAGEEAVFTAGDGGRLAFVPGKRAAFGGKALQPGSPGVEAPYLSSPGPGRWSFAFGKSRYRFEPLEAPGPKPAR